MYGVFTYSYIKFWPNVGKYSIHGASGYVDLSLHWILQLFQSLFQKKLSTSTRFETRQLERNPRNFRPPNSQRRRRATKNPRTASTLALKRRLVLKTSVVDQISQRKNGSMRTLFGCVIFVAENPLLVRWCFSLMIFPLLVLELRSRMIFVDFSVDGMRVSRWIVYDQKTQDKDICWGRSTPIISI